MKKFKSDIKAKTCKTCTFSFEKWKEILNPILRGKFNYFLIPFEVRIELESLFKERDRRLHGIPILDSNNLDGYVRQRLRVNFSCRGKKHGGQRQGKLLTVKYGNKFFIKDMGLVTGSFLKDVMFNPKITTDEYLKIIEGKKKKRTVNRDKSQFFKYAYAK